jgi:hypothetical protein
VARVPAQADLADLADLVRAHRERVVQVRGQPLLPVQVPQEPALPGPAPWSVVLALVLVLVLARVVPVPVPRELAVLDQALAVLVRVLEPEAPVQRLPSRRSFSAAMARNSPSPERPRL